MRYGAWIVLGVISVMTFAHGSVIAAQVQSEQPDMGGTAGSGIALTDSVVEIDEEPTDASIGARVHEILVATERFDDLRVSVRDGVVFIDGIARSESAVALATDIAMRTDGAVVVVNNLTLEPDPIWTLQPAINEAQGLLRDAVRSSPLLLTGVFVLLVFVLVAKVASGGVARILAGSAGSELLLNVIRNAIFLTVVLLGVYLALRITGLTRVALTVVSGTGLLGLALGFAFRDIAENFLASLLLSIQRPFRLGDVIEVDGHTGIVRKVTSRGTLLIDFDGNHIQIANSTVYKNTIKNFSANPRMRIDFVVGIGYDDQITHAQQVARDVLDAHPSVLNDPEPLVLVEELGSSTVNVRIYFWINTDEYSALKMKSSVIRLVIRGLSNAGISMPDEAREVIFPQGVPVRMSAAGDEPSEVEVSQGESESQSLAGADDRVVHSGDIVVDAEGDLMTETRDLNRQAASSRDPEEGANVFGDAVR